MGCHLLIGVCEYKLCYVAQSLTQINQRVANVEYIFKNKVASTISIGHRHSIGNVALRRLAA